MQLVQLCFLIDFYCFLIGYRLGNGSTCAWLQVMIDGMS